MRAKLLTVKFSLHILLFLLFLLTVHHIRPTKVPKIHRCGIKSAFDISERNNTEPNSMSNRLAAPNLLPRAFGDELARRRVVSAFYLELIGSRAFVAAAISVLDIYPFVDPPFRKSSHPASS